MSDDSCRADVWLWRARFFKTRSLAARFVDEGRVRMTRAGAETRLDKASRALKTGDAFSTAFERVYTAFNKLNRLFLMRRVA